MKLNKKGYMLVEIIVSFVLAISIAIYLLNLVIKFKDTNEKIYYSANYLKDKNLITRAIMEDLDRGIIREIEYTPGSNEIKFLLYIDGLEENKESRKLLIYNDNGFGIEYGKLNETGSFDKTDASYYKKTLQKSLLINQENIKIKTDSTKNIFSITIPIDSLYTNDNYDIIIFGQSIGEIYTPSENIPEYISNYIISLYNDESEKNDVTIGDGPQIVKQNTSKGIMYINQGEYGDEYRYYGANPNNYVEFNGELWRIISSSKVFSSESDTTGENRVRIIKDTSIGNYVWDIDNYSNDWSDATLMCQLNTMYYNDTIESCSSKTLDSLTTSLNDEARSLIDNALWYLGGSSEYEGLYADDYYIFERGTIVSTEGYPYRWTGKVGMMYPSDYAYGADLSLCKVTGYNYSTEDCKNTNWLIGHVGWLITPYSVVSYDAFRIDSNGNIIIDVNINGDGGFYNEDVSSVNPVVVLKSNIKVISGSGTETDPYQISI